jgi:hypothetical protein
MKDQIVIYRFFLLALLSFTCCAVAPYTRAGHNDQHQTVGDLEIYLTVVPAEMIRGYAKDHFKSQMHGGIPSLNHYHIIVVLFDKNTKQRITTAKVKLKVTNEHFTGEPRDLEPMMLAGELSYGNYFKVPKDQWFNIVVEIQSDEMRKPIVTKFVWART